MASEILREARTLALFSNLTPENSEYFRQNYPGFVPDRWWRAVYSELLGGANEFANEAPSIDNVLWRLWQKFLQESWTKLSPDRIIALLTMWAGTEQSSESSESEVRGRGICIPVAYPYQRAVMFLAMEQWRAKFCANCGKRFVKEKPRQKFCGDACFAESRKAYKRALWEEHPEWLENRKRPKKGSKQRNKAKSKQTSKRKP